MTLLLFNNTDFSSSITFTTYLDSSFPFDQIEYYTSAKETTTHTSCYLLHISVPRRRRKSSSTPVRPVVTVIEEPISQYQQPLRPGPLSLPITLPFDIGSTIVNPIDGSAYQLIKPLGNGSYAVVYMVREKNTGIFYALKCLSKANLSDYHLEIQHNEVRLHERLSHPNIVKLDNYFETPDWLFLVLEYCEGQDLYYWLTQNNDGRNPLTGKLLSEKERMIIVKQVFLQILDAVGYCHLKGIAHRDLKPENFIVMVKNEFKGVQVKLTDFGLATDEKESTDFDCGSKPYMSYECRNAMHDTYNPRLADIWSLGIILINLLYHRSPWADPNPEECKTFVTFQLDKTGFLMQRFPTMPKNVAQFLASRVFCNVSKGRINIKEWKNWCDRLVEKMFIDEIELEDVFDDGLAQGLSSSISRESSSYSQRRQGHDRHPSWSDVFGDFENELSISRHSSSRSRHSCRRSSLHNRSSQNTKLVETKVRFAEKDDEYENQVENANNSDADSGFGTDEDGNGNIIKSFKERVGAEASHENINPAKAPLSVSPPKVIYCKPKPWGDYRSRGHQREGSTENASAISNAITNSHWSSYNQRRERLEQRRKEKQEQTLNSLGAYRRRGSLNLDTNDSSRLAVDNKDDITTTRKRPQRPSNTNKESVYTTSPKRNEPTTRPSLRKKSSQSINNFPLASSPPKPSVAAFQSSFPPSNVNKAIINNSNMSKQYSPKSFDKTPKKVGRSTKNHLGKMLAGVVMFNRGVKVGGQAVNENGD
ncbi:2730_t:CDS:2 [Funneliformis geosporum]|uniref:601_t:CDS:1 n=1 Tax=Funneliformis geosporum TaxID=1117311 RepID=A0A9W4SPV6_9GLOM|nr:2730_t:CDS:2 [Funneliformis geosporum]CAI2177270.1 601_t:CDS:2 [Funneliformis geosporum]